jgi:transcriptional regulator with XRE-family HTH domain
MSTSKKDDPKFLRSFDRGMLRSAFVSLFWAVITERRKQGHYTLLELAKRLGANKAEVSRWFKGEPNWTIGTIANIANALDVEIKIEAIDRATGQIFTPSGVQKPAMRSAATVTSTGKPADRIRLTRHEGAEPEKTAAAAAA